jgi:hypothetical protein
MSDMKSWIAGLGLCAAFLLSGGAWATISYTAVDLTDDPTGGDLWQYRYTVTGSFLTFAGFEIEFDGGLYDQLEDPATSPNSDWLVTITQPDPGLGTSGFYSATAQVDGPSLADEFALSFIWLGKEKPGAQPFNVFDANFVTVESGLTTAVPEPSSLVLLLLAAVALAMFAAVRGPLRASSRK